LTTKEEIFRVWAPPESIWSPWVKPVLFASMSEAPPPYGNPAEPAHVFEIPDSSNKTMLVLDLRGDRSVHEGIELARRGYRPVPLFNSIPFSSIYLSTDFPSMVDCESIVSALYYRAPELAKIPLPADAPPAFCWTRLDLPAPWSRLRMSLTIAPSPCQRITRMSPSSESTASARLSYFATLSTTIWISSFSTGAEPVSSSSNKRPMVDHPCRLLSGASLFAEF